MTTSVTADGYTQVNFTENKKRQKYFWEIVLWPYYAGPSYTGLTVTVFPAKWSLVNDQKKKRKMGQNSGASRGSALPLPYLVLVWDWNSYIDRIVCHFLTLTLTLLIFLMKHSLHFATKLNSRDIDEKCNNYCFGYPSMIWGQGWWGVWGRSNLPQKKFSSRFWIKVWTSRIKNSWIRPCKKSEDKRRQSKKYW